MLKYLRSTFFKNLAWNNSRDFHFLKVKSFCCQYDGKIEERSNSNSNDFSLPKEISSSLFLDEYTLVSPSTIVRKAIFIDNVLTKCE